MWRTIRLSQCICMRASMEEISSSAASLAAMAEELQPVVSRFKV
nr:hypothetical protein [Brevibacillus humidisoli]